MNGYERQSVSSLQMGMLLFVYVTGSAIINVPGPLIAEASNGVWVSLLISASLGMLVLACLLFLNRAEPELSYVECSRKALGNVLTALLSVLTLSFLFHIETGIVIDVGLFMTSSMLRETPYSVFTLSIFVLAAVTARCGLEVMARMFTLILIVILPLTMIVLTLAIHNYHVANLLPIFPHGFRPIWHGAYLSFGFPFQEIFVFGMLLRHVRPADRRKAVRTLSASLAFCTLLLILTSLCTLMVFGPLAAEKKYSLFELARIIEAFEIIQRIESVIGMSLIAGSYMKVSLTLFVMAHFLADLCKLKDARPIMMPLALIGFLNTIVSFDSSAEWIEIVSYVHPIWGFFAFTVPLLLTVAAIAIRRRAGARAA